MNDTMPTCIKYGKAVKISMKIHNKLAVTMLITVCIFVLALVPAVFAAPVGAPLYDGGISSHEIDNIRVQVLSETLVRIEVKGPNGNFEDRPSYHIVNRTDWPGAEATVSVEGGFTKVATENYTVVVPSAATSLSGVYVTDRRGTEIWRYTSLPSASIFMPAPGATPKAWAIADNPRSIPAPWGYKLMPEGYTEFANYNGWDTENSAPDMFIFVPLGDAKQLRDDFTSLTGPADFPILKSFGLWHSRYYAYSETTALAHIDTYREHGFPLDFFVVDTDWRTGASLGYNVDTRYFPDMPRFLQSAHDKNVQIMFNDHPEPVQVGGSRVHSLHQEEIKYRTASLRSIFDMGLDVWWYDRNWSTVLISPLPGVPKESFGMYLYQAITADYWEDVRAKNGDDYARRPLIMGNVDGIDNGAFNNPPNLASHRFSYQWTGDNNYRTTDLQREVVNAVRSGALSANPYISSDISGHTGVVPPGMWIRWSQFAALSPYFRYHCTAGNNLDRSPWLYGEQAENVARDYINMRYRLLPLFYSLAHENYENGMPMLRRLDFKYPQYAEAQDDTQYTLGDNILVAPIWEADASMIAVPAAWLSQTGGAPGLQVQYFNNTSLTGSPVYTGIDSYVDFNWGTGRPQASVNTDNFSARWTGRITIGDADVKLALTSDDGCRMFIDGNRVINNWADSDSVTTIAPDTYAAGSTHDIIIEYYEAAGNAVIRLQYAELSMTGNSRSVFIPDGRWIDVWSGEEFVGPQTISVNHELETSPIFARSGSIIPLAENMSYIGEKDWSTIGLDVYPSIVLDGAAMLYEDDGGSVAYRDGFFRKTALSTSSDDGDILVNIGASIGTYDGAFSNRTWKVRVHAPANWGALLNSKLDNVEISANKITKTPNGYPFNIVGGSMDSDVYEIIISTNVSTAHEVRLSFATPVAEEIPEVSGAPLSFDVTETLAPASVNLTVAGEFDWVHYGADGAGTKTLKADVANRLIGDLSASSATAIAEGYTEFKWTDGNTAPAGKEFIKNGATLANGSFNFDLNVGEVENLYTIYLGGNLSSGRLTITDGRSARFVDLSNLGGLYTSKISVTAYAEEPATLHVKYEKTGGEGYIAIYAVAAGSPGTVSDLAIERFALLEAITGSIDLTSGSIDWIDLGWASSPSAGNPNYVNRKAGVPSLLAPPIVSGSAIQVTDYNAGNNGSNGGSTGLRYIDGQNPVSVSNDQHAIQVSGSGNSFQIIAPSTTTWRRLKIYCGVWQSTNRIDIVDESGVELNSYEFSASGNDPVIRCLNIVYRSQGDSNLYIKMTRRGSGGNISLSGYALYDINAEYEDIRSALQPISGVINLSGAADWVHLGYNSNPNAINRKAGVTTPILSDRITPADIVGVSDYNSGGGGITFNNGVNPSSLTGNGSAAAGTTTGGSFEISAKSAPDSAWRRLDVYLGVWQACALVEVMDSDRNVLASYDYNAAATSAIRRLGVLYRDCGGEVIVRITKLKNYGSTNGNISLAAYAVYETSSPDTNAAITVEPGGTGTVVLSETKNVDWAHFGYSSATSFNTKSDGPRMIGAPIPILGSLSQSNDFIPSFSWTGGSSTATVNNTRNFAYSYDGMLFNMNIPAGVWKFTVFTSVWWANGYMSFEDESGNIIGLASYESKTAASGTSEYRRVNVVYSSDEAHTITVRNLPSLGINDHVGNMSFVAVTVEAFIDHVSIVGGGAPNIRDELRATAFVSPDDSLPFYTNDGITFQWQKSESQSSGFVNIPGQTSAAYKPTLDDVGCYIRISASFAGITVYSVTDLPVDDLIFAPIFYDGKGVVCTGMEQKPLTVELSYYNRSETEIEDLTMFVAVYDLDGRMKSVISAEEIIAPDEIVTFAAQMTATIDDGDYAKVFLWTTDGYLPIREAYTFK